jgi:hypothetical protein
MLQSDEFLRMHLSLTEQQVCLDSSLQLRMVFILDDPNISRSDPAQIELSFDDNLRIYLSDKFSVPWDECRKLVALLMQIRLGDFDPSTPPDIAPEQYFPPQHRLNNYWESKEKQSIIREYQYLTGKSHHAALFRFITIMQGLH